MVLFYYKLIPNSQRKYDECPEDLIFTQGSNVPDRFPYTSIVISNKFAC